MSTGRPPSDAEFTNARVSSRAVVGKTLTADVIEAKSVEADTTSTGVVSANVVQAESAVVDDLTTSSFALTTGATDSYVLTSDASGVGTWQAAAGGDTYQQYFAETGSGGVTSLAGAGYSFRASRLGNQVFIDMTFTAEVLISATTGFFQELDSSGVLVPFSPDANLPFRFMNSNGTFTTAILRAADDPGGPGIETSGSDSDFPIGSGTAHLAFTVSS